MTRSFMKHGPVLTDVFVTCYSSSSKQLQRAQPSVFVRKLLLGVGINGEVDGREGDVTQEASFGPLTLKKNILQTNASAQRLMNEAGVSAGIKRQGELIYSAYRGALVLMMEQKSPRES